MKTVEDQSYQERRKHQRYNAADGSFAAISSNSYKLGQIVNISRGGLAFRYIDTNRTNPGEKGKNHIFLSSKGHYVQSIPFEAVADREVPNENAFSTLKMRQCAVRFGKMSFNQIINLDNYILHNTDQYAHV